MPFGLSSGIPNVIIHAKFHVDRLTGLWAALRPKLPFPILIGTTLTTVLHYRADCDINDLHQPLQLLEAAVESMSSESVPETVSTVQKETADLGCHNLFHLYNYIYNDVCCSFYTAKWVMVTDGTVGNHYHGLHQR